MRSFVFLTLLTIAAAIPVAQNDRRGNAGITITPNIILAVSPEAASCSRSAQFAEECRTADQSAPFVSNSFDKYNITTKAEAAAILSLILFESGGFKFNIHHFPGPNPGQGTRNMMNFPFILEFAHDVLPDDGDLPAVNSTNVDDTTKDNVLGKVLGDGLSFSTGAWFYQEKCDDPTKQAVKTGSVEGWKQYIEKCVGTTATSDREAGWDKATKALSA